MSNISMRTECGFLARATTKLRNSGQGATSLVEQHLLNHHDEEGATAAATDTIYKKLIDNNHQLQDSAIRSQSLPNCVEPPEKKCDPRPAVLCDPPSMPSSAAAVSCDINTDDKESSWFKTWPESARNNTQKSPNNCDENKNCEASNIRPIPLDQLLQSIPLAYSPITRQLHVLTTSTTTTQDEFIKTEEKSGGSPFSSLSSLSAELLCAGPPDDDSSDTTSLDAHLNKNLLGAKLKQGAFTNFFSRNLFSWKLSKVGAGDEVSSSYGAGSSSGTNSWKFFNRNSQGQLKEDTLSLDEACSSASSSCSTSSHAHTSSRFPALEASSGSLILEPRPAYLPAKSQQEEQRHRLQYQQMVQAAKKKELKEAKLRKKQLQQQLKAEDQLAQSARIWSSEVLPKWESMKGSRKVRDLWWQGLPPCVRGKVWRLAVGNELNLTPDLYEICVARAQERLRAAENSSEPHHDCEDAHSLDKESSVELIQLDIARTFPLLCIFQKGGPYYDVLHSLLGAYVCYRPDLGYVQGMSFIAAVLILNLEAPEAFVCFANMLNRPCQRAFFHLDEIVMHAYYASYNELFQENLPRLFKHFQQQGLTPDLYLLDWVYTMFSRSMPLDVACRVWDVYLRDGEEFLFRTALGVLHLYQENLVGLDFLHGAQFLTKLPDDLPSEALFRSIEAIKMCVNKMKFSDVLTQQIELAKTDNS